MRSVVFRRWVLAAGLFAAWFAGSSPAPAQLAWDASGQFQYNLLSAVRDPATGQVGVVFSVTNPLAGNLPWDIKAAAPFTTAGARLSIDLGWSTADYTNTGALDPTLATKPFGTGGVAAAAPISLNALRDSIALGDGTYRVVSKPLPPQARLTGAAAMEGHPQWLVNGVAQAVPVKSGYKYFGITDATPAARREIVDINKCKQCHTGIEHEGHVIPRLSLHGGNRTEEIRVCVVCHNPNQTDIPYRTSGAEQSIDFKRMVHGIHAGGFRTNKLVIVGFQGNLYDFSGVRFPAELRDCTKCHIDNGSKGTFELPLRSTVLGSTIQTGSVPGVSVDINPANDRKITPIAAVCSGCHDKAEVIQHMTSRGASFSTTQADITAGRVVERCPTCHGPGKDRDVRKVHQIGFSD